MNPAPRHTNLGRAASLAALLSLLCTGAFTAPVAAQDAEAPSSCQGEEFRQLDFWVGDWEVTDTESGEPAGTNRVVKLFDGCVIQENWRGVQGSVGSSYNIYDARAGRWHQTWVDNRGTLLQLDGGLEDGTMVLEGERPGPDGDEVLHVISFEPLEDGSVRQVWTASRDGGESWRTVFDGTYTKKGGG